MRRLTMMAITGLLLCGGVLSTMGCRDDAPPPPRVPIPAAGNRDLAHERDYIKPLPPDDWRQTREYGNPPPTKP